MDEGNTSVCAAPVKQGPNKGAPTATGTTAGYYRHRAAKEPPCEPCRVAHCVEVRDWAGERKEAVRARAAARNQANPTPNRERASAWYEANKERAIAYATDWRRRNPEKRAQIARAWLNRNPEFSRLATGRRRAAMRSRSVPFSIETFAARMAYWGNECWMCGGPFEHVDHVKPISRGGWHCLANLRPSCARCNTSKANRWPIDTRRKSRMSPLIR